MDNNNLTLAEPINDIVIAEPIEYNINYKLNINYNFFIFIISFIS